MNNPMQFPDGFVFGGATAAYQVEGETRTHGKGKVPWDDFLAAQGRFSPDPASDFYNKYPVDIDLCQRFGINGIRVSIAWSRIFPNGTGEINPEGVAFYHELFATCNNAGVIPYVTLDHFDTPEAFYQNGGEGFLTRTTIDAFVEYAKFCFAEFTEVKHWFTFNEIPATAEGSFIVGNWPHGEKYRLDKAFQLMHNMMVAHAKAVVAFHEGGFEGEIGIVQNLEPKYPLDPNNAADCEAARMADVINNRWVLDATFRGHYAADTMEAATKLASIAGGELDVRDEDIAALTAALPYNDCLGVNTYKCQFLRAAEGENDINHNGTGDKDDFEDGFIDDAPRIDYMRQHLAWILKAIDGGVNVDGYFVWSLQDQFSWTNGYNKRYGLFYIDFETQERYPKASAYWYKNVSETGLLMA